MFVAGVLGAGVMVTVTGGLVWLLDSADTEKRRRKLRAQENYHGVLPQNQVLLMLQNQGDFLVRESMTKDELVVFVKGDRRVHDFIIRGREGRWVYNKCIFATLTELVKSGMGDGEFKEIKRSKWQLDNDDLKLGDKIGDGIFGDVYKASYKGNEVAVKTCKTTTHEDNIKFFEEGRFLLHLKHPNIVKCIGIAAQCEPIAIVMELINGGTLSQTLQVKRRTLNVRILIVMSEGVASGMAYLESKRCIHRDLCALNCLVNENYNVKISDFGLSREGGIYSMSYPKPITAPWTAPEALRTRQFNSASDVWSYGILLWEVFSYGEFPYTDIENVEQYIETGGRMSAPENTPPAIERLMKSCWEEDPERRPNFKEICNSLSVL